ncbi:hypothetical protein VP01_2562g1 [Puccinia sorghi]|uniref:Uncharacterized protein n=1 Tax=Puccinia sorghi TaxID=27349 RepID=A0A0L6V6X0_9BASI|nr:hypothetical protein VP01_2562g1 [Puccinia sorghi]
MKWKRAPSSVFDPRSVDLVANLRLALVCQTRNLANKCKFYKGLIQCNKISRFLGSNTLDLIFLLSCEKKSTTIICQPHTSMIILVSAFFLQSNNPTTANACVHTFLTQTSLINHQTFCHGGEFGILSCNLKFFSVSSYFILKFCFYLLIIFVFELFRLVANLIISLYKAFYCFRSSTSFSYTNVYRYICVTHPQGIKLAASRFFFLKNHVKASVKYIDFCLWEWTFANLTIHLNHLGCLRWEGFSCLAVLANRNGKNITPMTCWEQGLWVTSLWKCSIVLMRGKAGQQPCPPQCLWVVQRLYSTFKKSLHLCQKDLGTCRGQGFAFASSVPSDFPFSYFINIWKLNLSSPPPLGVKPCAGFTTKECHEAKPTYWMEFGWSKCKEISLKISWGFLLRFSKMIGSVSKILMQECMILKCLIYKRELRYMSKIKTLKMRVRTFFKLSWQKELMMENHEVNMNWIEWLMLQLRKGTSEGMIILNGLCFESLRDFQIVICYQSLEIWFEEWNIKLSLVVMLHIEDSDI